MVTKNAQMTKKQWYPQSTQLHKKGQQNPFTNVADYPSQCFALLVKLNFPSVTHCGILLGGGWLIITGK